MAVDPSERGRGVGAAILRELENLAARSGFDEIMLNAREEAVSFYKSNGYVVVQTSHSLFGVIPHFEMRKRIR
jgi:ribosomal protein S18 acetylase RimI-like enzyme